MRDILCRVGLVDGEHSGRMVNSNGTLSISNAVLHLLALCAVAGEVGGTASARQDRKVRNRPVEALVTSPDPWLKSCGAQQSELLG
jgi:hypothetical protein